MKIKFRACENKISCLRKKTFVPTKINFVACEKKLCQATNFQPAAEGKNVGSEPSVNIVRQDCIFEIVFSCISEILRNFVP